MLMYREAYDCNHAEYCGQLGQDTAFIDLYNNEVVAVCTPGRWAGLSHMYAISAALKVPLRSYCPPVLNDNFLSTPLSRRIAGRGVSQNGAPATVIMWTSSGTPETAHEFRPDHFVTLRSKIRSSHTPPIVLVDSDENDTTPIGLVDTDENDATPIGLVDIDENDILSQPVPSTTHDPSITDNSSASPKNHSFETDDPSLEVEPELVGAPINKYMEAGDIIELLQSLPETLNHIPDGRKENVRFLVDNKENEERRSEGKNSQFVDDCGVWQNSNSPVTHMGRRDGKWTTVLLKDGQYYTEKRSNGKKVLCLMKDQPTEVVRLQRNYATLKRDSTYKRRISWIKGIPVAIVEYIGKLPPPAPHGGNAAKGAPPYQRTAKPVLEKIREQAKGGKKPKEIYEEMIISNDNERDKPADLRQVQNTVYQTKKKQESRNSTGAGNLAANFNFLHTNMHSHPFIQSIVHSSQKVPSITLFTDKQIADLKRFCFCGQESESAILGVDKTFNLGQLHVTATSFKNISLRRTSTNEHPIFLGPILIHGNSDWQTYAQFFSTIAMQVDKTTQGPIIGMDDEKALKKAVEFAFSNANIISCQRHLKANVSKNLQDIVGAPLHARKEISSILFGENGLSAADSVVMFDIRNEYVIEQIRKTVPTFEGYYNQRINPLIRQNVQTIIDRPEVHSGWTNNNAESVNHMLKMKVQWSLQDIPTLINSLHQLVQAQYVDVERALIGRGQFKLDAKFANYAVERSIWNDKTADSRTRHIMKFLREPKFHKHMASYDGLSVLTSAAKGRKPSQTKRRRAAKTVSFKQ
ncbi:uncharacterized protein LOC106166782 [Lingula anatina]|uniref:Uncharacterized protein LOC106166782 n=1 Tax=Lingula anatina TaxID=7574 RepID=A0A1S3IS50_LINAN|nr:uncharacterized protein LOC106166782 [Lingula anatina]|eukprot:XP_013400898.1 uncharacterized protein LOC106166782 [Lingula anatina]